MPAMIAPHVPRRLSIPTGWQALMDKWCKGKRFFDPLESGLCTALPISENASFALTALDTVTGLLFAWPSSDYTVIKVPILP